MGYAGFLGMWEEGLEEAGAGQSGTVRAGLGVGLLQSGQAAGAGPISRSADAFGDRADESGTLPSHLPSELASHHRAPGGNSRRQSKEVVNAESGKAKGYRTRGRAQVQGGTKKAKSG